MILDANIVDNLNQLVKKFKEVNLITRDQVRVDKEYVVKLETMEWREYSQYDWHDHFLESVEPSIPYHPTLLEEYEGI